RRSHGSWLGYVASMGDLTAPQAELVHDAGAERQASRFLAELEITPMTKSYKMLVLEAMLNADRLPGSITIDELVQGVVRLAERSARFASDLGVPLTDALAVRRHLEKNPIAAWESGAGTDGVAYFSYAAVR